MKKNRDQPAVAAPSINSLRQSSVQAGQDLRRRAEERLKRQKPEGGGQRTEVETARLVHELEVHQIELEMQNEELQQAHAQVDTLLAQYIDLYDFAPINYITLDREGAIRQVNLTGARLLGVERSRLVNRRFGLFVAEGDRRAFSDFLQKVFASQAKECCEVTLPQEGSQPLVVRIEGTRSEGGQECRAVALDITMRKLAEQTLRKTNMDLSGALAKLHEMQKQMIQQERLSALGQMAGGIAHDFNNALVPILGYADYLLSVPGILDNRKETVEMLKQIRVGAENAAETVRRLQEFYRPSDRSQQEPVDLSGVIRNTVAFTRPRWKEEMEGKGIAIDIRTEITPAPPVTGDEHELSRLMTNLIFNAVDAMPKGGNITIRLHPDPSGKHAVLEVQDTGVGMSEEVRRKCLDPFFSTKGGRGVGLGLSVSHGIVQRHKGSIEIQSEPGKGAKIIIQLPLKEPQGTQPRKKEEPPPHRLCAGSFGPPLPRLLVLFVDDEESARLTISRYLEADGHTVKLAISGREGLTSFKAGRFDLVIVDRAMPGMRGDELAAAIKAISPETPVIMLTGFGDIMRDQGNHPVGVDIILTKPLTREALRRAIAEIMAGKGKS